MVPFATAAVTLRRYAAQTFDDNVPVQQTPTTSTIYASIQQPEDQDIQHLDDGERKRVAWVIFTPTEVRVADQYSGTPADEVVIDGTVCEVHAVQRWRQLSVRNYRAVLMRVQELAPLLAPP